MKRLAWLLLLTAWGSTVQAQDKTLPSGDLQFFESKVRPLLVERCHSCHSAKAKKLRGGLLLDNRAALLKGGDSGPALVPGEPDRSLLIKAIRYHDADLQMPPTGKLPDQAVAVLTEWVRRGAPFPGGSGAVVAKEGVNLEEGRKFWSFQPLRPVPPPAVKNSAWPRKTIDRFLLAELDKRGLAPSATADPRVLIRRASFDLIGLPPTPEEMDAFVGVRAEDAYARLIDKLLASPHYGERWGRHWLDLVRYCDIGESWVQSKGKPYLYRDWVIRALQDDMPYDQFVQKQLAADLMPGTKPADLAALGFLGLSPQYWKELNLDKEVIRVVVAEEWEERIAAVTGTFLGLTVACARCHDHKFDPITMHDYYALAGVLASSRLADRSLLPEAQASAVRKAHERVRDLQKQIDKLQAKKPVPAEGAKQIEDLKMQIETLKKETPHFDSPEVAGLDEAGLYVLADGPHRTKVEYKPGVALDLAVQIRGNPANPGPVVPRRFLAVLSSDVPKPFIQGSGRLELAQAMVKEAGLLAARVLVNRVWKLHFGTGLVETLSDFGAQGDRPSHPQLLDDLAARFVQNGWSIKWLHREIMLSAAYQQTSLVGQAARLPATTIDPDNRLLWRMNRRRLDVEAWRDAMLAVAGTLKKDQGGPALDLSDPNNTRRTLYGIVKRRELNDVLRLYDFPDPVTHSATRVPTTTPLQQLFTLNSPFVQNQSAALVRRLKTETPAGGEGRVRRAYQLLFGRPPTEGQLRVALTFLTDGQGSDAVWEQYVQVLLGSNEFMFVD